MNKFETRFYSILNEQEVEKEAMVASLDKGTDPSEFDTAPTPGAEGDPNMAVSKALSERETAMVTTLDEWIGRMDEFLKYLNGTENSIQTTLAGAEADTLFDRMKQSEQRKIARVATEIAALAESFKGYKAQSGNPHFKYV